MNGTFLKERKTGNIMKRYTRYMIMLFLFMVVGYLLFYLTYGHVKKEMIEGLNQRQMIHARQAATGIETFFNDHVRRLEYLAKNEHIAVLDQTGIRLMSDYHLAHREEVSIISRIDIEGRILHPEPYNASVVRQPVTSMEDFNEAKRTGQIVVSDVFTNRRGFKTILVHAPVFRKGSFDGTLALLLPFDLIAKRYVEDIRIGRGGYAWVISRRGIELCCPVPSHVGKSVFDNCRDFPDILAMAERMIKGEEGVTTYLYDHIRGDIVDSAKKQAVFMPIRLGNNFWSIVIATPEEETLSALDGFQKRLMLIAVLFVIGIGFFFYMLFKTKILVGEIERRKRTEQALQDKTEELDKYFTSSLDLLCIADTDGYFRRLNPEWEKTLGYALSELEGKRFLDYVHPEDVESTVKSVEALAQAKEVLNFINRYRHKDGSYRWIEWRSYPVEERIYAVARDITERIRVEREMAVIAEIGRVISSSVEIEEVYDRFAIEARKLIVFDRLNVNLIDLQQNKATVTYGFGSDIPDRRPGDSLSLTGSVTEAVMRLRRGLIADLENTEEVSRRYPALLSSYRAGIRSVLCVPLMARDGVIGILFFGSKQQTVYGEREIRLAERIGAQIAGALANVQLFNNLIQTEKSLRLSEQSLKKAQRVARLGNWTWRIKESQMEWSEEMYRIFGLDKNRFTGDLGEASIQAIHPDDRAAVERSYLSIIRKEKRIPVEYRVIWPDRSVHYVWEEAAELTFDHEGFPDILTGIALDITERKRMEEERLSLEERLHRAEKMEALGQLAGGVAHDLNNVLGVLVGYSELLLLEIPEENRLRGHVSNILQSGQKGAAIIQDLLTLARRGVAVSQVINLNQVISDYLKSPEFEDLKTRHPRVTFKADLTTDLLNILGSPVHLGKTVMNLISNAVEAISDDGEVTIRSENRHLDRSFQGYDDMQEGDYVALSVSDTGQGISPADLGRIFDPFYTKKVMGRSGTGLGLTVVWGTVKDHHGYIDVESEEGKGSVFALYFPVTRETLSRNREGVAIDAFMGQGESILVVDDVKEQRELAASMLTKLGYRVNTVASGEEALVYLQGNRADLVILDMIMDPGMDGLETYEKILAINPGQKALIVSGFSETDKVKKAQELGAGAYVEKPYVLEKIGLAVRKELRLK